jgi:GH15 family glucan-1,4-alpha-glucosidase
MCQPTSVSEPIESYALLGDMQTAALVSQRGCVDWLCMPRFDSPALFASLLGDDQNGAWRIAPTGADRCTRRQYDDHTLVLHTDWESTAGSVRVIDFMPPRGEAPDVVRIVEGLSGRVEMTCEVRVRYDYGSVVPWVRRTSGGFTATAGPDSIYLATPVHLHGRDFVHTATFSVAEGERVPFVLTWHPSNLPPPKPVDAEQALADTYVFWHEWLNQTTYDGEWRDAVLRSLITLKALTYQPTGGVTAAATTSLPEVLGGERNWDYRYCWLRDATMTLNALIDNGFTDEAKAWRTWLLRSVAGDARQLRIMYGLAGERRIPESELDWLAGYEGSRPVRIGNAAAEQQQLDVFGELLDAFHVDRLALLTTQKGAWSVQRGLLDVLVDKWKEPDKGLWEMRGDPKHYVHSKVMAWVGFDRAVKAVEDFKLDGPVDQWRALREEIFDEICEQGFDSDRNTFVQSYGSKALDASLLLIPQVGFLPADDPRVVGTIDAIMQELTEDGFVRRYDNDDAEDGLAGLEGTFIACTIWLADDLHLCGRSDEARALFERVLDVRNDVGLLAEEYDVTAKRQVGNVPQAYSHVALVNTARALSGPSGTAR